MKHIILAATVALTAMPAVAQMTDPPTEREDAPQGRDLMEEGAMLLLRGLMKEASPALRELQDFADDIAPAMKMLRDEMGPALADVMARIDDIKNYGPPDILPNGDIIIRRRPDAPTYMPPAPGEKIEPGAEIDL